MQHLFCPSLYYTLYTGRLPPISDERRIPTPLPLTRTYVRFYTRSIADCCCCASPYFFKANHQLVEIRFREEQESVGAKQDTTQRQSWSRGVAESHLRCMATSRKSTDRSSLLLRSQSTLGCTTRTTVFTWRSLWNVLIPKECPL